MPFTAAHSPLGANVGPGEEHTNTHLFGTTKAHFCTNTAESLTFTLLSILRHRKTRLTYDTREGTLRVGTCSLGACGGQCTLINI